MGGLIGRVREMEQLRAVIRGDGPAALVLAGRAGVGKTRLLRELIDAALDDWHVERVLAAPGMRGVSFAAVSHLLFDEPVSDPALLFRTARMELQRRAGRRRLLLAVDDAHELDDGSAGLVHQMAVHGEARVVVTVRPSAQPPAALTALWKDGHAALVEVEALTQHETAELAAAVLSGPVDDGLVDVVWNLSRGHPLYVVVALEAARESGSVRPSEGRWRIVSSLASKRLQELIAARLAELGEDARRALELVSVAEPIPARLLAGIVDDASIEDLWARGVVSSVRIGDQPLVAAAHPLFAEVALTGLAPSRRKEIAERLVKAVTAAGEAPVDVTLRLRTALLMVDSGAPIDVDLACVAARDALWRADYVVAERLAQAAMVARPGSSTAAVLLARSLGFQGRGEEALDVLADGSPFVGRECADAALTKGHILAFVLGRPDDAADVLQAARVAVPEAQRWQLDSERSLYSAIAGDFADTVEAATATLANADAPTPARVTAHANLSLARAMTGRFGDFDGITERGEALARRHRAEVPLAAQQLASNRAATLIARGRLAEAERMCARRSRPDHGGSGQLLVWLGWHGLVLGMRGRLIAAIDTQTRAIIAAEEADPYRLRSQAVGMWLMHHAQTGTLPADAAARLEEASSQAGGETRLAVWVGRARAWMRAIHDREAGARLGRDAGRSAVDHDHVVWGAWALHDAVRMGHAELVLDDLTSAVAPTEGAFLLETMLEHARALAGTDAAALEVVGDRLVRHGSPLYGAEAWAGASQTWAMAGEQERSEQMATRAALLLRRCENVATPAVIDLPPGLSDRELEVAVAACRATSREIADELFLSVRTVDNHLASVYRKLGVSGREELSALLATLLNGDRGAGGRGV